ncbi:uncharacterized protein KY384_006793 [Bacidia gigantensis]|uniref:uncharacterized protein n=1 Tax=Bacidia gigantensis TaxID=2732470 RepID=UPI001D038C9F|nr:uncharacterized protein KY384_006793 [Bacidia gigantensis]KAG8527877.1 hypothetical protein KY384_006793 [Bacidia gigantensis]
MMNRRLGNTLQWNLGFPTTVPSNAEIFKSARTNSTEDVRRLLSAGKASPQDTTIFGTTLLHSASRSGNLELVRLLIREGADVNAQDEDGESPLHGAMGRADNYDVARTLVENGADLLCKAVDGKTPFHNIFNNTISLMLVKDDWLENMPPDSEAMSMTHYLAWSSQSTLKIFQRGHSYDDVHLMSPDSCGRTCLHLAASRGNLEVLSYLVSQASSEDVEKKDVSGRTPLHYAAESSRAGEVIDTLMRKGCNIHAKDNAGQNGLHWAARRNNLKAAEKLITLDGWRDLLSNDMSGRTPSQEVSMRISPALYSLLRELETSDGRWTERSSSEETRPGCVSSSADDGFSPGLEIFGILAMIFIMLLGAPD